MEPMKVLVVDDEPDVVQALRTRLVSRGYEVLTAQDGLEATARIQRERPDLVLLDIHLPAGSGLTICERMRRNPATRAIPVVAITADPSLELKHRCLESGCCAFYRKPYDPRGLMDTIARIVPPGR